MSLFKRLLVLVIFCNSSLANAGYDDNIITDKDNKLGDELILPKKELEWSITPRLLTGVMYFKHITLERMNLSNKPVAFGGLGLNVNLDKWFLYGYGLDTAKTTDRIFEPLPDRLSESNYVFQRQDYAVTLGREISDLFSDSKTWSMSLFAGYRYGKTKVQSTAVTFNSLAGISDSLLVGSIQYSAQGPLAGIGLKIKPFGEKSTSQLGLSVGYGPLKGKYLRVDSDILLNTVSDDNRTTNTGAWIVGLSWEGQFKNNPQLSYGFVADYYAYNVDVAQGNAQDKKDSVNLKEAVGSFKAFLNYHFK